MRLIPPLLAIAFLSAASLRADGLADLKAVLSRQAEMGAVRARIEYSFRQQQGDEKEPMHMEGRAETVVEDSAEGLRIFWSRGTLDAAARELAARAADPDRRTPTRRVMDSLDPQTLSDYLNASPGLLRKLEGAQLVEEREDSLEGRKVRLLVLKLQPKFNAQDRKYVKQWEASARIWVGPDGRPLASESRFLVKGRAMLVVSFDSLEDSHLRFGSVAGRLVVLHHEKSTASSGAGEKSSEAITADLRVEPAEIR